MGSGQSSTSQKAADTQGVPASTSSYGGVSANSDLHPDRKLASLESTVTALAKQVSAPAVYHFHVPK